MNPKSRLSEFGAEKSNLQLLTAPVHRQAASEKPHPITSELTSRAFHSLVQQPVAAQALQALSVMLFDLDDTLVATAQLEGVRQKSAAVIRSQLGELKPFHGLLTILRELQTRTRLGIVTASPRHYAELVLAKVLPGISWEVVVTGTDLKENQLRAKPYPDGLALALARLGQPDKRRVAYVGDNTTDVEAAYHAGIRPVLALWAHRHVPLEGYPDQWCPFDPYSTREVEQLARFFRPQADTILWHPSELVRYQRQPDVFLPALENDEATIRVYPFCRRSGKTTVTGLVLGRYYRRDGATLELYGKHALSQIIREKDDPRRAFEAPERWVEVVGAMVEHVASTYRVDLVTVVPAKKGRDPRLERLLERVQAVSGLPAHMFRPTLMRFTDDAGTSKELTKEDRRQLAVDTLQVDAPLLGERVLVIDDVVTTGSTLLVAQDKLRRAGASEVRFLSLTQTVSGYDFIVEPNEQKDCPKCGRRMTIRVRREDGRKFWGCTGYPRDCRHSIDGGDVS